MKGSIIAFDPCPHCENHDMCSKCELTFRRSGVIANPCEWISVEERLPEVRQRVLLYSHHDGVNTGYRADEIGRFYVDKSYPYRPTHWMPLPEPPKGGEELWKLQSYLR